MALSMLVPKPRSDVFSVTTDWFRTASSVLEHGLSFLTEHDSPMSALGQKQTSPNVRVMSVITLKSGHF